MAKFSEMDYVYNFGDPFVFRKVKVETYVEEDGMLLKLFPEYMMTADELNEMLNGFQKDILEKRNINLASDCKVKIFHGGNNYNVEISEGTRIVKGILPA